MPRADERPSMRRRLALVVLLMASTGAASGCVERMGAHATDLKALVEGDKSFGEVVAGIADKEFHPSAQLFVEHVETNRTRPGDMRATERADRGYVFHFVTVRVVNNGTVDLPVSTGQFSAQDERGSETAALTSLPHHDFDGTRIRPGGERWGTLVFEMREDLHVEAIVWDGMLASASGRAP